MHQKNGICKNLYIFTNAKNLTPYNYITTLTTLTPQKTHLFLRIPPGVFS